MPRSFDEIVFDISVVVTYSDISAAWVAVTAIGSETIYGTPAGSPAAALINGFAQLSHECDRVLTTLENRARKSATGDRRVLTLSLPSPKADEPPKG